MKDINKLRNEYQSGELSEKQIHSNPFHQFEQWLNQAITARVNEPTAMVLSSASNGRPSSRVVLLKDYSNACFTFFTNYQSKKGRQLTENPHASLLFFWPELERQVRIEGYVIKSSNEVSDRYFNSRPKNSRIGAYTSPQSQVVKGKDELGAWFESNLNRFKDTVVARPAHWGGYNLIPVLFEFWQGRPSRMHDRIEYTKTNDIWDVHRLAP